MRFSFKHAFAVALAHSEWFSTREFCAANGMQEMKISNLKKDNPKTHLISIKLVADAFGMRLSEFIKLGEVKDVR